MSSEIDSRWIQDQLVQVSGLAAYQLKQDLVFNFFRRLRVSDNGQCVEWDASVKHRKKEALALVFKHKGETIDANRLALEFKLRGIEPKRDQMIERVCGNPLCLRFEHLRIIDRVDLGRIGNLDETRKDRKLTYSKAEEIRRLYHVGIFHGETRSVSDLSKEFAVAEITIRKVLQNKRWFSQEYAEFLRNKRSSTNRHF